jgi:hemolysin III
LTKRPHREQTPAEELANAITHGVGFLLSIVGVAAGVVLAALRRDAWTLVSVIIYGATLCLLYLASTLYHSARTPRARRVWNVVDHAAIYLLIAGTYTPFTLGPLRTNGGWGWSLFVIIWLLAATGVVFQIFFIHRYRMLSTLTYVLMGWLVLIALRPLWQSVGTGGILWLAGGGLCYTLGVAFYVWKNARFAHAIWHLFVLAGCALHFLGVLHHVVLRDAAI